MSEPFSPSIPDIQRMQNELLFLSELSRVMASTTEVQPILDWIVGKTVSLVEAEEGSIRMTVDPLANTTRTVVMKPASKEIASGSWPRHISMSVMGFLSSGRALVTPDLHNDDRFAGLRGEPTRIRACLAVPLIVENRVTGMLAVTESQPGRRWTPGDEQLLGIVAQHSAGAIESARLRAEAIAKKELEEKNRRMEDELARARETQMTLVPAGPLQHGPWMALGRIAPARAVGGDAFDYFPLSETRFGVMIADVSGKGVPAALLMSNVVASMRAFCTGRSAVPAAIRRVNQSFSRTVASGKFITLWYGELDHATGVLKFVNAGHNPPLLRRADGSIEKLSEGGVPIGIFDDWEYVEGEVVIGTGDAVLLYSDGVTEALDRFGAEFGEERLEALWRAQGGRTPSEVIELGLADVATFRGSAEQSDDITFLVVSATPAE
jgi:serine phosphatase RsbU (regulator of sigma subunit)